MEVNPAWAAPCGVWCRECPFFESPRGLTCGGCYEERLCHPADQQCEFIICTRDRKIEHCGLCSEFPCERLIENYQRCSGESPRTAVFRIGDLAIRARLGTDEWATRKIGGSLPWAWVAEPKADLPTGAERRRYPRGEKQWPVQVSFLPGPEAFGLSNVTADCMNLSPIGMMLSLPDSKSEGLAALIRTEQPMEVEGVFPTARGGRSFSGKVVWHNLGETQPGEGLRVGVSLVSFSGNDP